MPTSIINQISSPINMMIRLVCPDDDF